MIKGVSPIGLIIVFGFVLLSGLVLIDMDLIPFSIFPSAAIVIPDPSCSPGFLIRPIYGSYTCLLSNVDSNHPVTNFVDTGVGYFDVAVTCSAYNKPLDDNCKFFITSGHTIVSPLPIGDTTLLNNPSCSYMNVQLYGGCGWNINAGETRNIRVQAGLWTGVPAGVLVYREEYLRLYAEGVIPTQDFDRGCGLEVENIGDAFYQSLSNDNKGVELHYGSGYTSTTGTIVVGWDEYPLIPHVVEYQNDKYICRVEGVGASLFNIDKLDGGVGNCNFIEGSRSSLPIECCPGQISPTGRACKNDLTWDDPGGTDTGCCIGGVPTDLLCLGGQPFNGYDFGDWTSPGDTVCKKSCDGISCTCSSGECVVAMCNPLSGAGCFGVNVYCNPLTFTCESAIDIGTCSEKGHECCLEGMFQDVSDIITCDDIGKEGEKCIGGFCFPTPPTPDCNYNDLCEPQLGETTTNCIDCKGKTWFDIIMEYLSIFIAGFVISGIIVGVLWFIPFTQGIIGTPGRAMLLVLIIASGATLLYATTTMEIAASLARGLL